MADLGQDYFFDNFNTPLGADEPKFQDWLTQESYRRGRDLSMDLYDYDLRGAWQSGQVQKPGQHGTDEYKKPNHPTFSDESIYHGTEGPLGTWVGGKWGNGTYTPSEFMLQHTMPAEALIPYFKMNERGTRLILPSKK